MIWIYLLTCFMPVVLGAAEPLTWPSFRGLNASGISSSARPPVNIGPSNRVAWKVSVPYAPSSPSIAGDRIFLTAFDAGELQTRAYRRSDGKLLWSQGIRPTVLEEFHATEGSPAAATPATDGHFVVNYFGSHGLVCYDVEGRERWQYRLPVATTSGNFGSGTSALILGDAVILSRDMSTGSSLLAVSLTTGKRLWETPRPDSPTSYGSPIVWSVDGTPQLVVAGSLWLKAYDPASGNELWKLPGLPSYSCTTPVVGDGLLFYAGWSPGKSDSPWPSWESVLEKQDKDHDGVITPSEYSNGAVWFKAQDLDGDGKLTRKDWDTIGGLMKKGENVLLAIKPSGKGELSESHIAWKYTRGLPYVPSPLFYDGRVYMVRDGGMLSSFDSKTGRAFYEQERVKAAGSYYASPVAADGKIYLASLDGTVSVIRAGGDMPEILHQAKFGERITGSPALVGDTLYLRTQTQLYAFR